MAGTDQFLAVGKAHFLGHGDGGAGTGFLGVVMMLAGHLVRRSAGAAGIGENVHIRKGALPDEIQTLLELLLRFTGEGYDHVGGNGTAGEVAIQQFHGFQIPGGIVFPLHALEHRVTAALHGQVELRAEIAVFFQTLAELLRDDARLQTAQTNS